MSKIGTSSRELLLGATHFLTNNNSYQQTSTRKSSEDVIFRESLCERPADTNTRWQNIKNAIKNMHPLLKVACVLVGVVAISAVLYLAPVLLAISTPLGMLYLLGILLLISIQAVKFGKNLPQQPLPFRPSM